MSFQVIQRDQTDNSVDKFQERLQQQQQMMLKAREIKSTLEIEREKLKIQQKHAKTEEEKMSLDKRVKNFEMATKVNEILTKSSTKPDGTFDGEGYEKSFSQVLMQPGNEDLVKEMGNLFEATKGSQMGDVDAAKTMAEGEKERSIAGLYGGLTEGMRGGGMGGPGAGAGPGAEGVEPTSQGRAGLLMPQLNIGGAQITNVKDWQAMQDLELEQKGRELKQARDIEIEPLKRTWSSALGYFARALQEGGRELGESGLEARVKGMAQGIRGELGKAPATQALSKITDGLALQTAAFLNKGRPNEADREAAKGLIFNIKYPLPTNLLLIEYVSGILEGGDTVELDMLVTQLFGDWKEGDSRRASDYTERNRFKSFVEDQAKQDTSDIKALVDAGYSRTEAEEIIYQDSISRLRGGR